MGWYITIDVGNFVREEVGYRDALASKYLLNEAYIMGVIPINPEIVLNN